MMGGLVEILAEGVLILVEKEGGGSQDGLQYQALRCLWREEL
jgi:hypothetical protein